MEYVIFMELEGRRRLSHERKFKDISNPLEKMTDTQVLEKFRFPKLVILEITDLCLPRLIRKTQRNHALPPLIQVLAAIRFYARGSFQDEIGDIVGITQPSVHRAIKLVTSILCRNMSNFIRFPISEEDILKTKVGFYNVCKFPNVIGLVDGTLVDIISPGGENPAMFVSRKGGHSINVQIVCNSEMMITDIVSKWGGSTHDSFMWQNSSLRNHLSTNLTNGWLLGDSGYPQEPWLMTPFAQPSNDEQERYNKSLVKTRRLVENCIGLLKKVFRSLDKTGGRLSYRPSYVCNIIGAVAILHNIRRRLKLPIDEEFEVEEMDDVPVISHENTPITLAGVNARERLVTSAFS